MNIMFTRTLIQCFLLYVTAVVSDAENTQIMEAKFTRKWRQAAADICPNGYVRFQRSCYRFHEEKLSWPGCITFCQVLGSSLVILDTMAEYEFLVTQIKASTPKRSYWIAISDANQEGVWTWVPNGSSAGSIPWANNQPNDYGGKQDCAAISVDHEFGVNDLECDAKYYPVCEINLSP